MESSAQDVKEVSRYYNSLLSSMSPLVTLDADLSICFVNESFRREFETRNRRLEGEDFFAVIELTRGDRDAFMGNLGKSRDQKIQNAEFKVGEKRYGYSVFRFEDEIGIILKNITDIKKLERKVAHLHTQLLTLQERERERLAAELHDGVSQTLMAAKLNLTTFQQDPENSADQFETGLVLLDRASQELREIYTDLFPSILNEMGLESTIRWYARNFLKLKNIETDVIINLENRPVRDTQINVFRIVQEIFNNIIKHSKATQVKLELDDSIPGRLRLYVEENGIGFSPQSVRLTSGGFGLENIHRRVDYMDGTLTMDSEPGKGTRIEIQIPLTEEQDS